MPKSYIRLAYRQFIDATSATPFEQQIFYATWSEFRIQQQSFSKGRDLFTWTEIKNAFPKSNPALPFKVSFAIAGLINDLGNQIPGLHDTLGHHNIPFQQHRFELIQSNAKDSSQHQVSITYITPELSLYEIIGSQLLLSLKPPATFMIRMQPGLAIVSYVEASKKQQAPSQQALSPFEPSLVGQNTTSSL